MEIINVADILKYAPKDTVLYTEMFGTVLLDKIVDDPNYPIHVTAMDGTNKTYTANGGFSITTSVRCGIWPSSEKNLFNEYTWDNWQKYIFRQKVCKGAVLCRNNDIHDKWIIDENCIFSLSKEKREHGFNKFGFDSPCLRNFKFIDPLLGSSVSNNVEINPKPGELVLVSLLQENDIPPELNKWQIAVFSHKEKYPTRTEYIANSRVWKKCLPFNKYTSHLIGTDEYDFVYTKDINKK